MRVRSAPFGDLSTYRPTSRASSGAMVARISMDCPPMPSSGTSLFGAMYVGPALRWSDLSDSTSSTGAIISESSESSQ